MDEWELESERQLLESDSGEGDNEMRVDEKTPVIIDEKLDGRTASKKENDQNSFNRPNTPPLTHQSNMLFRRASERHTRDKMTNNPHNHYLV